jgi:hypothetical protein
VICDTASFFRRSSSSCANTGAVSIGRSTSRTYSPSTSRGAVKKNVVVRGVVNTDGRAPEPHGFVFSESCSFVTMPFAARKPPSVTASAVSDARPSLPAGSDVDPCVIITRMVTSGARLSMVTTRGSPAA